MFVVMIGGLLFVCDLFCLDDYFVITVWIVWFDGLFVVVYSWLFVSVAFDCVV